MILIISFLLHCIVFCFVLFFFLLVHRIKIYFPFFSCASLFSSQRVRVLLLFKSLPMHWCSMIPHDVASSGEVTASVRSLPNATMVVCCRYELAVSWATDNRILWCSRLWRYVGVRVCRWRYAVFGNAAMYACSSDVLALRSCVFERYSVLLKVLFWLVSRAWRVYSCVCVRIFPCGRIR